jgi:hypothetical protein
MMLPPNQSLFYHHLIDEDRPSLLFIVIAGSMASFAGNIKTRRWLQT